MKKFFLAIGLFIALAASPAGAVVWTMPSGNAPGPTGQNNVHVQGLVNSGGQDVVGSIKVAAIGTPSAPVLSTNGTAGSTSIVYACIAFDFNGNATIPSSTATITTANATLSTTNSVNITCGGNRGAVGYLVAKVDTSHILASCYTKSNTSCTVIDDGSVATTFTYTPQTADQTGAVVGGVVGQTASGTVANLPACAAGNAGQQFVVTNSTTVAAEGQTCVGSSTHTALAICLDGAVWKCF